MRALPPPRRARSCWRRSRRKWPRCCRTRSSGPDGAARLDHGAVFRPGPAAPWRGLAGEARSLALWRPSLPDPASLPSGQGRQVLVVPAFLTGDGFTVPARRFLTACGFRAVGWGLGLNWGPTAPLLAGLRRRVEALSADGPILLVGYSLGGVLARLAAQALPARVAHLATLGSPVMLPTTSPLAPLFRPLLPRYAAGLDPTLLARPLLMPVTAIWTRQDGIVAPESCLAPEPGSSFEVDGRHMTLGRNPAALALLVRRLAG